MTRAAVMLAVAALLLVGCAPITRPGDTGVDGSSPAGSVGSAVAASAAPASPASASPASASASPSGSSPAIAQESGGQGSPSPTTAGERSPRPTFTAQPVAPVPAGVLISGTLGFDSIEGGCAYLEVADGTRYQVIYPSGWRLDRGSGRLFGPEGSETRPGATVTVRGSVTTEIASICQIGPVFKAVEVLSPG